MQGLRYNTTGNYNTNSGMQGLRYNTTGYNNTNSGMNGLHSNTTGYGNTNSGVSGLYSNTTGYSNTNSGADGLRYNTTGYQNTNSGMQGLYSNTTGINNMNSGYLGLRYMSTASQNTSVGAEAFNTFNQNTGGNKTFDYTDITVANEKIKVSAHGFGSVGVKVMLLYTQGTSAITGMTNATIYQFTIIHADTIQLTGNITDAGTGTGHTLTPQYEYSNSTAIGYNAEPTASNQVVLGDANVTTVNTTGFLTAGNIDTVNTPTFTTDIAAVGRVLVIPAGYWVEGIKIIDVGTAAGLSTIVATQETSGITLITGKAVATGETMMFKTITDHNVYATAKNLTFTAAGNGNSGCSIVVYLRR